MRILEFDWRAFDPIAGAKYATGVAVIMALPAVVDFNWFAAGISALLVWLTNLPGPRRERVAGALVFIAVGAILVGLAHALHGTYWPWLVATLVVAFLGTFAMILGSRGFMVGWCLIVWFYCTPLLGSGQSPVGLLAAHLLGGGVLLLLVALPDPRSQEARALDASPEPPPAERPALGLVTSYSTTMAVVMAVGLAMGDAWLKTDPTVVMNAALMVLMPNARRTWAVAADRVIGALSGVVAGFYLGQFAHGPVVEVALWLVGSFLCMAMLNVNAGAVIFFFLLIFSESWGALGGDAGHAIANERILGELAGVAVAALAIWGWQRVEVKSRAPLDGP